jgi:hypothetical protein
MIDKKAMDHFRLSLAEEGVRLPSILGPSHPARLSMVCLQLYPRLVLLGREGGSFFRVGSGIGDLVGFNGPVNGRRLENRNAPGRSRSAGRVAWASPHWIGRSEMEDYLEEEESRKQRIFVEQRELKIKA